jgi:hypothetical protein
LGIGRSGMRDRIFFVREGVPPSVLFFSLVSHLYSEKRSETKDEDARWDTFANGEGPNPDPSRCFASGRGPGG